MSGKIDDFLPDAMQLRRRANLEEAKKADTYTRVLIEAELEKRALIESLGSTTDVLDEQNILLASAIIQRAARNGDSEVQVCRFSHSLCADGGRAISDSVAGWENTLAGVPQKIYRLWSDYLRPRGYQIRYVMIGLPDSLPENIGVIVSWED